MAVRTVMKNWMTAEHFDLFIFLLNFFRFYF